ncbi:hypothetical protein [Micromonospora psammae]|uniref:hypothetical protein n=1 Tax=Micromonospora sp. CPCC 205556 TaxID=3122398 RepID=UPI002FF38651
MSKRFLTKLAGGLVLGSVAVVLAAPASALAATDPGKDPQPSNQGEDSKGEDSKGEDSKGENSKGEKSKKKDDKPKTFKLRDKKGNGVICATNEQANELRVQNIVSDNTITDSVVVFNQNAAGSATNTGARALVVCIRDLDVDVNVETELLDDILRMAQAGLGGLASPTGQRAGRLPAAGGAYAGPDGAWVLPRAGGVAAGDGGAFADSNTAALTATGAGMMGVGVLGGLALLRRRSANGTVA